jgi:hypothetical protein
LEVDEMTGTLRVLGGRGFRALITALALAGAARGEPGTNAEHAAAMKWHPGHYIIAWPDQSATSVERFLTNPVVRGVKVLYFWRDLEPRKGEYDFSRIEKDLAVVRKHDKQLFIMVYERRWGLKMPAPREKMPVPNYLLDDPIYNGAGLPLSNQRGWIARLWHPPVMERLCALVAELGKRFDTEPNFEGINTEETAIGLDERPEDFTTESQLQAWKSYATALGRAFPHSTKLIFLNWFQRPEELAKHCAAQGVGFGGPDIVPFTADRRPASRMPGERAAEPYQGQVPIGRDVQSPDWEPRYGSPTPQELFDHAVDELHCNYVFWSQGLRTRKDLIPGEILPLLAREKGRTVTTPPASTRAAQ